MPQWTLSPTANKTMQKTFYWYDYETFGIDPQRDRPVQFAGLRTDEALNVIGDPLVIYSRLSDDYLPHPEACLVTGITPQVANERGVPEGEFIGAILAELARPGTCSLGYNTLRFDDEVTRNALYRNLFDPYAREWQNGNSRWDLIDVIRLTRALRPEGLRWPDHEDGTPSFRLEDLTHANGIEHGAAHDALADVYATIALARLVRESQPRLFEYLYRNRDKKKLAQALRPGTGEPHIHVSARYPASQHCLAAILPLAWHPTNRNGVIVYDLSVDPGPLLTLDAESIRERLFTPVESLPEGATRIPLKLVHLNKSPVVVPYPTLREEDAERLGIDRGQIDTHRQAILSGPPLTEKLQQVFEAPEWESVSDPDLMIYSGGFFSDRDRARMEQIRKLVPKELAQVTHDFDDPRLPEMLFRYRARNFPETLDVEEQARWKDFCRQRLTTADASGRLDLERFNQRLAELSVEQQDDENRLNLLQTLAAYGKSLANKLDLRN